MAMLVVSTDAGDIAIQEHEISTITAAELCQLRISRADLRRRLLKRRSCCKGSNPAIGPGRSRSEPWTAIGKFTPIPTTKR
jgi:hypothetical protein